MIKKGESTLEKEDVLDSFVVVVLGKLRVIFVYLIKFIKKVG